MDLQPGGNNALVTGATAGVGLTIAGVSLESHRCTRYSLRQFTPAARPNNR